MRRRHLLTDPLVSSLAVFGVLVIIGVLMLALGSRGIADQANVALQLPYVVSAGFGGLALIGFALGVLAIQHRRWTEAHRRAEVESVLRAAEVLLAAVQAKRHQL